MLETIFKMRLKKWTDAIAILDANTDNLHSDELEAIGALKNLWRTVSFGPSCTQRVERMVKVLSDADKLHGNNRDIIQASKDFRGVAKEMYTTDAETLEQFRTVMQQTMGGPRRTAQQQQRRNERPRQQQTTQNFQPRPHINRPQSQQSRPQRQQPQPQRQAMPYAGRPTATGRQQDANPPSRSPHWLEPIGRWFGRYGLSIGVGAGLTALIAFGCFLLFQTYTNVALADGQKLFGGNWHGELNGNPATLIVDTVNGDTMQGRLFVKDGQLRQSAVGGSITSAREGYYLFLTEMDSLRAEAAQTQADSTVPRYRLFVGKQGHRLSGLVVRGASTAAIDLHKEGADSLGGPRHHATLSPSGLSQYVVSPTIKDSVFCTRVVRDKKEASGWKPKANANGIYLAKGELIDSVPQSYDKHYFVFMSHGKYYRLSRDYLIWSQTNNPVVTHTLSNRERQYSNATSVFFASMGPCWTIVGLLVMVFAISITGMRLDVRSVREAGLVVVPLCLLAVAVIEIYWYRLMGAGAFWWCDYNRYGFLGTLLRVIPFLVVVAVQLFSIKMYELLLCCDGSIDGEIHVKPAVIGILVSFPTLIVYFLVTQLGFHWKGETAEMVGVFIFLLIILVGIVRTFMLNIKDLGALRGSLISVFILVYAVSCIVAVTAFIFVIVRILLVMLAALFALAVLGGTGGHTLYRDKYGNLYRRV